MTAPLHLLLIEDQEADAQRVRALLADPALPVQVSVQHVRTLQDAEQSLAAQPADLILLNSELDSELNSELGGAGGSALAWLAAFKAQHPLRRIPVIVLTRLDDDQQVQAAYQQRASAYLVKPEGQEELREMLLALLLFWGEVARLPPSSSAVQ